MVVVTDVTLLWQRQMSGCNFEGYLVFTVYSVQTHVYKFYSVQTLKKCVV